MTADELQQLFRAQIDTGAEKLYYMTQQPGEANQPTVSVLIHNTAESTFEHLLTSLEGYTFQQASAADMWPRFLKDTA